MTHDHTGSPEEEHSHDHAYLHAHGIAHSHGHVHANQKAVINRLARSHRPPGEGKAYGGRGIRLL